MGLSNSLGITAATLDGGAGADAALVSNLTAKRLIVNLGAQGDVADVRSSLFDELYALMGEQDDSLTVYANYVRLGTALDGGAGTDILADLGHSYFGAASRRSGFER